MFNVPYTVRNHSFDVLGANPEKRKEIALLVNHEACLGILTFPFTREILEADGVNPQKIHDCFPVVAYDRFLNRSPNGSAIMNVGAAIPKKNMVDFLELSKLLPERVFNLYAMGYDLADLLEKNSQVGGRVNFFVPVDPEQMPAHYKRHEWLVYTASHQHNTVGWPLAVAEAQAAGVGVCMQNIRPDLRDYVGEAGFLFNTPAEAAEIIRHPFPNEKRELGFELAKRSDIKGHIHLLTDLWQRR